MKRGKLIVRRGASVAAWMAGLLLLLLSVCSQAPPALAAEGTCPNEARRSEQASAYLANCRAYEQVTPSAKDSGEPQPVEMRELYAPMGGALAAANGERLTWITADPGLAGPESDSFGLDYLSTRGPAGWRTEETVPPQSTATGVGCPEAPGMVGWSRDFSKGVLADGAEQESGDTLVGQAFAGAHGCGHDEPRLVEGEPEGFQNLFLRDNEAVSYQLINVTPLSAPHPTPAAGAKLQVYFQPNYLAASAELEHVAFEDELPLSEEAEELSPAVEAACKEVPKGRACWEGHDDLYVWSEGQQPAVRLASILPDAKPAGGVLAGTTRNEALAAENTPINVADYRHAVSADGARIFFESAGNLYVRENGGQPQSALVLKSAAVDGEQCLQPEKACTIQLDASQGGAGSGGGRWLGASAEGTRVFFVDEEDLTADATAGAGKPDLYEYDFEAAQGQRVKDLTVDATEPADVQGVSGISEDGSYVYFVAAADLTGSQRNSQGDTAFAPAQGSGDLVGGATASGTVTAGSTNVALTSHAGELHVGQEVEGVGTAGKGIPAGTTIAGCSPSCAAPTDLTLSHAATETATGSISALGEYEVTGVTTSSGAFRVGMSIAGAGIPADTSIAGVGSGTLTLSNRATASGGSALSAVGESLYVSHGGTTAFIATLNAVDECDWTFDTGCYPKTHGDPEESGLTARISGDGRYLAFNSVNRITGYANGGPQCRPVYRGDTTEGAFEGYGPGSCEEIYLYAAEGNQLACVSCNPASAPSANGAAIDWPTTVDRDGSVLRNAYPQRNVSETGQVFFETAEALLPRQVSNGVDDVYEYEHGTLHLISSGTGAAPSYFVGASANGSDVFFATAQKLLPRDTDSAYDIYDAREYGGFPEPPPSPSPCETEGECKNAAEAQPVFSAPASVTFAGPGDIVPAQTTAPTHETVDRQREAKLREAVAKCARYRHRQRERRRCEQRARKTLAKKAKASRRRGGAQ